MYELAAVHDHPLVRARALLAWGAQSATGDFGAADAYWPTAEAAWRPYVLVAIQDKEQAERDRRYEAWSGEERFLRAVAEQLRNTRLAWTRI